jgi:hypothetical protein
MIVSGPKHSRDTGSCGAVEDESEDGEGGRWGRAEVGDEGDASLMLLLHSHQRGNIPRVLLTWSDFAGGGTAIGNTGTPKWPVQARAPSHQDR